MIVFCKKLASWLFFESLATIVVVFFFLQFSLLAPYPPTHILDGAARHGLLDKLRRRGSILRTSLYADATAVFVAPFKENTRYLAMILENLLEATGLCTNVHKSSVVPIRCGYIDLEDILEDNTLFSVKADYLNILHARGF
jgi:hypothetical protein